MSSMTTAIPAKVARIREPCLGQGADYLLVPGDVENQEAQTCLPAARRSR